MTQSKLNKTDILIILGFIWISQSLIYYFLINPSFLQLSIGLFYVLIIYFWIYSFFEKFGARIIFIFILCPQIINAIILAIKRPGDLISHPIIWIFLIGLIHLLSCIYILFIKKYPAQKLEKNHHLNVKEDKKLGTFLLLLPFLAILVCLSFWAKVNLFGYGIYPTILPFTAFMEVGITMIALIIIFSFTVWIVLGLRFLLRKEPTHEKWDQRSGQGKNSEVPEEIKKWNWGAAGLTLIWGVYYKLPLSLLMYVPFLNLLVMIIFAVNGNEWAWRRNRWRSPKHFLVSQKKWMPWGIIFFVIRVVPFIFIFFSFSKVTNFIGNYIFNLIKP